jgi:hypothetical protein
LRHSNKRRKVKAFEQQVQLSPSKIMVRAFQPTKPAAAIEAEQQQADVQVAPLYLDSDVVSSVCVTLAGLSCV